MSDTPDPDDLKALQARIDAAKASAEPEERSQSHESQVAAGWRMVIELVVGLVLGLGIGYGLDHLFGTLPIFLIIFALLGFAAGVRTMMRTAHEIQAAQIREADAAKKD